MAGIAGLGVVSGTVDGACETGLTLEDGMTEGAPCGGRTTPLTDTPGLTTLPGGVPLILAAKCGGFSVTGVKGFLGFA